MLHGVMHLQDGTSEAKDEALEKAEAAPTANGRTSNTDATSERGDVALEAPGVNEKAEAEEGGSPHGDRLSPRPERHGKGLSDQGPERPAGRPRVPWKRIAIGAGGLALTVGGTVVATLAATHSSARRENAAAYAHGLLDAVEAIRNGYDPLEDN